VKTVLRQSNLKFRPEKLGIMSISLMLVCSILKSLFRFNLTCYMSWSVACRGDGGGRGAGPGHPRQGGIQKV